MTTLVWFRQDLRIADNPALSAAVRRGPILPVYIIDEGTQVREMGAASRWWLHHSLTVLDKAVGGLVVVRGNAIELIPKLAREAKADAVMWNRVYEPGAILRDTTIKADLAKAGVTIESFNGALLHEPWTVKTGSGGPFKVYSPYWRACLKMPVDAPLKAPTIKTARHAMTGQRLARWGLLPTKPNWAKGWDTHWTPGEAGAMARLDAFLERGLLGYGELRNRADLPNVSRLSPHLHFGEISPRQVWARTRFATDANPALAGDGAKFLSEIGWREFAHHLLYHFPDLPDRNWKTAFDAYPWRTSKPDLTAWQRGMTGYPFVDAGMRELWQTGTMHNRVRMVVASFLIKHLRIDWRQGEAWFWDTLVDADLANNAAGWQWVAGSGADASPYFRIFNPIEQGRKFDLDGVYIRRWCPELAKLPDVDLFWPHDAAPLTLKAAGVTLGKTYPRPIVDHREAREAAMAGYAAVKARGAEAADQ